MTNGKGVEELEQKVVKKTFDTKIFFITYLLHIKKQIWCHDKRLKVLWCFVTSSKDFWKRIFFYFVSEAPKFKNLFFFLSFFRLFKKSGILLKPSDFSGFDHISSRNWLSCSLGFNLSNKTSWFFFILSRNVSLRFVWESWNLILFELLKSFQLNGRDKEEYNPSPKLLKVRGRYSV